MKTGLNPEFPEDVFMADGGQATIFQPRVIVPHFVNSKLYGWSARLLSDEQVGPKYKHTPGFPADRTLFNWDNVQGEDMVIVVESPMSVLYLMSHGWPNAVATFGSEVNDPQIDLLARFEKVVLFPDGDKAGYRSLRWRKKGKERGSVDRLMPKTNVYVVDHGLVDGEWNKKDPANYTEDELNDLIDERIPAMLFTWRD